MNKIIVIILCLVFGNNVYCQDRNDPPSQTTSVYCSEDNATFAIDLFETPIGFVLTPPDPQRQKLKIVIGEAIDYEARSKKGNMFNWTLGSGQYWPLNQFQNNTSWAYKGKAIIPLTALPLLNTKFGSANGQIIVTKMRNGQIKTATETVKVYYDKDGINPNQNNMYQNTSSELINGQPIDVPNWFYYWSQAPEIQSLITNLPGIKLWNIGACSFTNSTVPFNANLQYSGISIPFTPLTGSKYGGGKFMLKNMKKEGNTCSNSPYAVVMTSIDPYLGKAYSNGTTIKTKIIRIGKGCGYKQPADLVYNPNTVEGIHTLYSVLFHEIEHMLIFCENWQDGYYICNPGSNCLDPDADDDGYRDTWEVSINLGNSNCPKMFNNTANTVMMDDVSSGYNYSLLNSNPIIYSAGTEYEECRCRLKEKNSNSLFQNINSSDWSFDKANQYQGKQW